MDFIGSLNTVQWDFTLTPYIYSVHRISRVQVAVLHDMIEWWYKIKTVNETSTYNNFFHAV